MLYLSEIMLQHHELETFEELLKVVQDKAGEEIFFRIDVKPPFPDTPPNWEDRLVGAFVGINSVTR